MIFTFGLYLREQKRSDTNITQPVLFTNGLLFGTCCPLHTNILESSISVKLAFYSNRFLDSYRAYTTRSHSIHEGCREVENIAQGGLRYL